MKRLDHYWYSHNPVAWLLLPLSYLFCTVAVLRRYLYRVRVLRGYGVPVPVIIVGNISVGGTGKTPLLIALCELLARHGYRPGVVSRGYGAAVAGEHLLTADDDAVACGDEPVLIRQRTGCPVAIGRDRVSAARSLLAANDCGVILSDDGLQHYRLQRDIEIAVVDVQRKFGNGLCLPAGPLREPRSRLNTVDMVVYHGDAGDRYRFSLQAEAAVNIDTGDCRALDAFTSAEVHGVAGIGYPERFFNQLSAAGLNVIAHAFPDHHVYSHRDIEFGDGKPVLMTEKDAVKCRSLRTLKGQGGMNRNIWAVPVRAVLSEQLAADLLELLGRTG